MSFAKRSVVVITVTAILMVANVARAEIQTFAQFGPETPPGNIAIGDDGRIFMSLMPRFKPTFRVVEVLPDGKVKPYPTDRWARAPEGDGDGLNNVLGIRLDEDGILWMLDWPTENAAGRLVGWDTKAERLDRIIYLAPPVTRDTTFLNDLAVDREHEAIYISDTGSPENAALIVVDLRTGRARRMLEGSRFTVSEDIDSIVDGRVLMRDGKRARIGVDGITVDPANKWLYFAPHSGTSMYRVRTADLLDQYLSQDELESRVERYGDKPISGGITVDGAGNVYLTSTNENAIGVVRPDGSYEILYQGDDISWPDGFAFAPDGMVYVTVNELHHSTSLTGGDNDLRDLFQIKRFAPIAPGSPGR